MKTWMTVEEISDLKKMLEEHGSSSDMRSYYGSMVMKRVLQDWLDMSSRVRSLELENQKLYGEMQKYSFTVKALRDAGDDMAEYVMGSKEGSRMIEAWRKANGV